MTSEATTDRNSNAGTARNKPGPDDANAGCVSCQWGGVPSVRHTVCRTCRPPEWDGWEARESKATTGDDNGKG